MDFKEIARKWQKRWIEDKVFEANPDSRKKFFVNVAYPYINAYPHIGHLFTFLRTEIIARYKRMQGFNVLFPQGWHATGSPIINAALRIKNKEDKQIKIMKDMGFSDDEIKKFEEPDYWVKFFVPEFRKDFQSMGFSIDWRREFHTTSLNPPYDRFIQWQFRTLHKKGYIGKGKHPVVWCNNCNSAVGDHSRVEGEGESPQEFTLLKFKMGDKFLIAATLRPETVYGQTNLWVKPDSEYKEADVDGENWVGSAEFFDKLSYQEKKVKITGSVSSNDLLGRTVIAPMIGREIIILPSHFCDPTKGTGIVTSVPSDAPDDWIGLRDLQENEDECRKYRIDCEAIKNIKPIPIIDSEGLGDLPAVKMVDDMNIKNQFQRKKLEEAKKIVYKKGFYAGVLKVGEFKGLPVEKAKEKVKALLIKKGEADIFYELTGRVVCRCLTPSVVKIVSNQWFLYYGDEKWKKLAKECLDQMQILPEKARAQFEYVIDWLRHWACTREQGLGTKLPWQKEWVIESLSDSTIYMAYYTIAHKIKEIDPENLDDNFFDYVFLNKDVKIKVEKKLADELREEFNYWYPFDMRLSGKDLIQNHLTFCIFNHTAIFPKEKWPRGFAVNGWVTVDGQKMSKSLGNMISLRDMCKKFGPDVSRFTILSGGESLDDPNWDTEFAISLNNKFVQLAEFCVENYGKGTSTKTSADKWMENALKGIITNATNLMEETLFRSAIQEIYFELQRKIRWYLRRSMNNFNKDVMSRVIETQVRLIAPFIPHIAEEIWEKMGKDSLVSLESWPEPNGEYDEKLDIGESIIENILKDINHIKKLAKIEKPEEVKLFVAQEWKYELFRFVEENLNEADLMKKIMSDSRFRIYGKDIAKIIPKLRKQQSVPDHIPREMELEILQYAVEFIGKEAGCKVIIYEEPEGDKAKQAMPGRPALLLK